MRRIEKAWRQLNDENKHLFEDYLTRLLFKEHRRNYLAFKVRLQLNILQERVSPREFFGFCLRTSVLVFALLAALPARPASMLVAIIGGLIFAILTGLVLQMKRGIPNEFN